MLSCTLRCGVSMPKNSFSSLPLSENFYQENQTICTKHTGFQPEHYIKMLWVFTLPNWKSGICKFNMKLGLYFGSIRTLVCVCLCEVLLHERKRMTKTKECNLIRNKLCAVNPVWCVVEISFRLQYHTHSHTHTTNPKFCFFRLFSLCWRQSTLVNSFILQVYHHK